MTTKKQTSKKAVTVKKVKSEKPKLKLKHNEFCMQFNEINISGLQIKGLKISASYEPLSEDNMTRLIGIINGIYENVFNPMSVEENAEALKSALNRM